MHDWLVAASAQPTTCILTVLNLAHNYHTTQTQHPCYKSVGTQTEICTWNDGGDHSQALPCMPASYKWSAVICSDLWGSVLSRQTHWEFVHQLIWFHLQLNIQLLCSCLWVIVFVVDRKTQKAKFCLTKYVASWTLLNDTASDCDLLIPISRE